MDFFIHPFLQYGFMQQALLASVILCLGAAPVGCFVVLRRLSLVGDTLSHGMLPGVAIAFVFFGFSILAMSIGAIIAALAVAFLSGLVARQTRIKEDASFASFYLLSLAFGTCVISAFGNNMDLLHFMFGNLLAIPNDYLYAMTACSGLTIVCIGYFYKQLIAESFDPQYMRLNKLGGDWYYFLFLFLFVINIVSAFFALGTLLALGLFILPVIVARLWARTIGNLVMLSILFGIGASYAGLLLSYYKNLPAGPAIVLCLGTLYLASLFLYTLRRNQFALRNLFYPSSRF